MRPGARRDDNVPQPPYLTTDESRQNTGMAGREAFWNIDHVRLFYALAAVAMAVFAAGCWRNIRVWRKGWVAKGAPGPRSVLPAMLKDVLANRKIFLGDGIGVGGLAHMLMMWGFGVLFIGTVLLTVDHYLVGFLKGAVYQTYAAVLDVMGLAFIAGVIVAGVRRYVIKRGKMVSDGADFAILFALLAIAVTGFLVEAFRIASFPKPWTERSPVGLFIAARLSGDTELWHRILWWVHAALSLTFIAYLPFGKLFHMIAGPVNVAWATAPPGIVTLEERETLAGDFSRRHMIAFDACTRCNRCDTICPSNISGEGLSPRGINQTLKAHVHAKYGFAALIASLLKKRTDGPAAQQAIAGEDAWMCTTCRACVEECPLTIDNLDIIRQVRTLKVEEGTQVPTMVAKTLESLFTHDNPYQLPAGKRGDWAEGLDVVDLSDGGQADMLYFVGCAASYDTRLQNIARAAVEVLGKLDVSFGIMGADESCCGDLARRLGEDGLVEEAVVRNCEKFANCGVSEIVTTCPHSFKMFRDDYPLYRDKLGIPGGTDLTVRHSTQVLAALAGEGRLTFSRALGKRVTYHDPCYLGRHCGIYEPPRQVIRAIPGIDFVEMKRNRRNSFCCGGGGGRTWMEEFPATEKIAEIRVKEAIDVGAELLITACPFCLSMLEDAAKTAGYEDRLEVKDIMELTAELI